MTDASLYTGAHKERFNADGTGKGKIFIDLTVTGRVFFVQVVLLIFTYAGVDGREDRSENTGFTGQYKGADTYG